MKIIIIDDSLPIAKLVDLLKPYAEAAFQKDVHAEVGGMAYPSRRYGAVKDTVDARDQLMKISSPLPLPSSADESRYLGPVRDQGAESSCVGHGWAAHFDWLWAKFENIQGCDFSPQFIYYLARKLDGTLPQDAGATIRAGARALNRYGATAELYDPYGPRTLNVEPSDDVYLKALTFKGGAYHRLQMVEDMKACLASGYCFVDGIEVFSSFESKAVAQTGEVPLPKDNEETLGGHCTLTFGYDDNHTNLDGSRGAFHKRNSWGEMWGNDGNFWLPYSYAARHLLDAWTLHLGPAWK